MMMMVSECSCVRTSRALFVLPMYEEFQPGQMNSELLSLVLVKKHNFVVFSLILIPYSGRRDISEAYLKAS